jgi:hypothetical protein
LIRLLALASLPPGFQNRVHLIGNLLPGKRTIETSGQQRISFF